jgi:hypothetical protein
MDKFYVDFYYNNLKSNGYMITSQVKDKLVTWLSSDTNKMFKLVSGNNFLFFGKQNLMFVEIKEHDVKC